MSFVVIVVLSPAGDPVNLLFVLEPEVKDVFAAALPPEAFNLVHFVHLGPFETFAERPSSNGLPVPFEPLPSRSCAGPPRPVEPLTFDSFCDALVGPGVAVTAAVCVTVTVY